VSFYDSEWYPMILVGRTGQERPKIVVEAKSIVTKVVEGDSKVVKVADVKSQVPP